MKCPVCNDVRMREVVKNGVMIDTCPDCKGVWLDRGELDKLMLEVREIETSGYDAPPIQQNNANNYPQNYGKQEYYRNDYKKHPYKKKKSVMDVFGDLFD